MSSIPNDDSRFDDAEADVDRGTNWMYRESDAPNPLTIEVTEWSTGVTKLGEAEWMNGVDRSGKRWSVLVGSKLLTKGLIEGLVEEWSNEKGAFVVTEKLGRVQPGEVVSIKYLGDRQGAQYLYPDFNISRKPRQATIPSAADTGTGATEAVGEDDIPFLWIDEYGQEPRQALRRRS